MNVFFSIGAALMQGPIVQSAVSNGASTTGVESGPPRIGLVWADLNEERLHKFYATEDECEQVRLMSSWVEVHHYEENPRSAVMVDFFLYGLIFCKDTGLTLEQTSALFSILKVVFDRSFGEQRAKPAVPIEESFEIFKQLILDHGIDNPPAQVRTFSQEDVRGITEYISKTFYRHYKAYQLFSSRECHIISMKRQIVVEEPMPPLPLAQGTPHGPSAE